jgi:hypothetical protein
MRRIIVEVAPAEMPLAFRFGRLAQRAPHAPPLRGAGVLDEASGEFEFFRLEQYHQLWRALRRADEVVTWNGNHVALLVLRRLFGAEHFPIRRNHVGVAWGEHIDVCELIERERRLTHRISLAKAIRFTFGERVARHRPSGRICAEERVNRCRAATGQIFRLWQAYRFGDGLALQGGPTLFHPENSAGTADG